MRSKIIFFVLLCGISFAESTNVYKYDFKDPESIVRNSFFMLKNADFEAMLEITELNEKKRVSNTINEILSNPPAKSILLAESKKIKSFEIIAREDYTNNSTNFYIIFITKWVVLNDKKSPKNADIYDGFEKAINSSKGQKKESIIYVDYLLKNFDGKWKIISKRSK